MAEENTQVPQATTNEESQSTQSQEETEMEAGSNIGNLFSPEGVIMLLLAAAIDLIGLIVALFIADDYGIVDIIAFIIIGGWMYFRSSAISVSEKTKQKIESGLGKIFKGPWKKYLTPLIGEILPLSGPLLPLWTIAVYYELIS